MKKIFIGLGIVFLLLIIWLGSQFLALSLDYNKSESYVKLVVDSVIPTWNSEQLKIRFHPKVIESISEEAIDNTFSQFRNNFKNYISHGEIKGEIKETTEGIIGGVFEVPLKFENTNGLATITIQKYNDNWVITDFRVKSTKPNNSKNDNSDRKSIL